MKEPEPLKNGGRVRLNTDDADTFLKPYLLSALAPQITEADGTAPRWFRVTALLILLAASEMNVAQFWRTGHRVSAAAFTAVTTVATVLGQCRVAR